MVRDSPEMIRKIDHVARSVQWESKIHHSEPENGKESILVATKLLLTLPSSSQ